MYLFGGFQYQAWGTLWQITLIIPIYYGIGLMLYWSTYRKRVVSIATMLVASIIYIALGILSQMWHPGWLIFIVAAAIAWYIAFSGKEDEFVSK